MRMLRNIICVCVYVSSFNEAQTLSPKNDYGTGAVAIKGTMFGNAKKKLEKR